MTTYEARYKALLRRITEISDMRPRAAAKALTAVVYAHNMDTPKRGRPAPDQAKVRQAWNLSQRGWPLQEIGVELGISKSTAGRWVRQGKP
jgi:hypothetical protein